MNDFQAKYLAEVSHRIRLINRNGIVFVNATDIGNFVISFPAYRHTVLLKAHCPLKHIISLYARRRKK